MGQSPVPRQQRKDPTMLPRIYVPGAFHTGNDGKSRRSVRFLCPSGLAIIRQHCGGSDPMLSEFLVITDAEIEQFNDILSIKREEKMNCGFIHTLYQQMASTQTCATVKQIDPFNESTLKTFLKERLQLLEALNGTYSTSLYPFTNYSLEEIRTCGKMFLAVEYLNFLQYSYYKKLSCDECCVLVHTPIGPVLIQIEVAAPIPVAYGMCWQLAGIRWYWLKEEPPQYDILKDHSVVLTQRELFSACHVKTIDKEVFQQTPFLRSLALGWRECTKECIDYEPDELFPQYYRQDTFVHVLRMERGKKGVHPLLQSWLYHLRRCVERHSAGEIRLPQLLIHTHPRLLVEVKE